MKAGEKLAMAIEESVLGKVWPPWGKVRFSVAKDPEYSVIYGLLKIMQEKGKAQ